MERIVIEVDDSVAKAFGKFSPETKTRFNETVAMVLKKIINDASSEDHKLFLDTLSAEAARNGLTEDILQHLLKADG